MGGFSTVGVDYDKIGKLLRRASRVTVFVINGLDQSVTVQVRGNRTKSVSGAINVGSSFVVPASSTDARTLSIDTSGWLPALFTQVSCTTAPTAGALTVYLVRNIDDQDLMVNNLAIRDTNVHDPSTDPNSIFIVEW